MLDYDKMSEWVSVCEIRENELCFTQEFIQATEALGGNRRALAAHLVAGWERSIEGLLDYFGPDDMEKDLYDGIDGHAMDINEMIPDTLEVRGLPLEGLESEWFRDLLRAKLATVKIPKSIIEQYVKIWKERFND